MALLDQVFGGGLGALVKNVVGSFKLDPEKKAEFQAAIDENAALLAQKQLELQSKYQDAITEEVKASAEVIKLEAQSQSWLPRNVRPLLMLLWGGAIAMNIYLPLIAKLAGVQIEQLVIDPWVYKMTTICVTGYVGFRSIEKIKGAE